MNECCLRQFARFAHEYRLYEPNATFHCEHCNAVVRVSDLWKALKRKKAG